MERTYDEEIHIRINHLLHLCADAMFRRCNQNRVNTCGKRRVFFTNSWRIKIALESYFEEHAQEVWKRNWMNLEM